MKKASVPALFLILIASLTSNAAAEVSAGVYGAVVDKYLWRGQLLSSSFAAQPGASVSYGGFTFDAWFSHQEYVEIDAVMEEETSKRGLYETDLTLTYEHSVPGAERVLLSLGLITYLYNQIDAPDNDSEEFFVGLSADVALSPSLTFYYDDVLAKGAYLEAGTAKALSFNDWLGASLGLSAGYNFGQYEYESSFTVIGLRAGIDFGCKGFTITPAVFGQLPLDDQYEAHACGSITIAYDFTLGGAGAEEREPDGE